MGISVVIAAGGTGGHLIPALAIADAIKRSRDDVQITFVGTARALDRELIPRAGYRMLVTSVRPFSRNARGALAPLSLAPATMQARRILKDAKANVAIGMGGYASVPVIAAARLAGVASLVHEANAVPGLANELCARFTPNVAVGFPEAARAFGRRQPRLVGMPVRVSFASFDRQRLRSEAMQTLRLTPDRPTVLVFGGSQGATRINEATLSLAERWRARDDVQVLLLAGNDHAADAEARAAGTPVRVLPFLDRMELGYAAADVVVSRAGASTLAELAVTASPAILVPYPHARRREQDANARSHARDGGALVIDDASLDGARLSSMLEDLLGDPGRLAGIAEGARSVARPHAADEMAAWAIELAEAAS